MITGMNMDAFRLHIVWSRVFKIVRLYSIHFMLFS